MDCARPSNTEDYTGATAVEVRDHRQIVYRDGRPPAETNSLVVVGGFEVAFGERRQSRNGVRDVRLIFSAETHAHVQAHDGQRRREEQTKGSVQVSRHSRTFQDQPTLVPTDPHTDRRTCLCLQTNLDTRYIAKRNVTFNQHRTFQRYIA